MRRVNRVWRVAAAVVLLGNSAATSTAQIPLDRELVKGIRQVEDGYLEDAVTTLEAVARRIAGDPAGSRELTQAYLYLGIAYAQLGTEKTARATFREALKRAPDLKLDADRWPPKVVRLFTSVHEELASPPVAPAAVSPLASVTNDDEPRILYAVGLQVGQNMQALRLSAAELEQVKRGVSDAALGKKPEVDLSAYGPRVQQLAQARSRSGTDTEKSHSGALGDVAPSGEDQKVLYAMGLLIGRNVRVLNLTPAELEHVNRALVAAATGQKPEVDLSTYGPRVQQFSQDRIKAATEAEKARGQAFRDAAGREAGAVQMPSGLVYKETWPGHGRSPRATDTVRVHYRGTFIDGVEFDSSITRGQPAEFPLNGVIPCWTEGVQRMKVGSKARLICPSSIAYGDKGSPPVIPGGATLVFEVELLDVKAKDRF